MPKEQVVTYEQQTDAEYFGSVSKVEVGNTSGSTLSHRLSIEQARKLRDALSGAVSHAERCVRQQNGGKKRSYFEPINTIIVTTHVEGRQVTVLGKQSNRQKQHPV